MPLCMLLFPFEPSLLAIGISVQCSREPILVSR